MHSWFWRLCGSTVLVIALLGPGGCSSGDDDDTAGDDDSGDIGDDDDTVAPAPWEPVGVGLEGVGGWSLEFVDAARTLRAFTAPDDSEVAVDDAGWPLADAQTVLWDRRPMAAWWGTIDDPEAFTPDMAGTYRGSFTGVAEVSGSWSECSVENVTYDPQADRTTFDLVVPETVDEWTNAVVLEFTGTAGGIRDLSVTRPGYDHDAPPRFHQPFLDAIAAADFSTLRFMDWTHTNDDDPTYPAVTEWADRAQLTDATWLDDATGHERGAPWETVVELANTTGLDVWINVPVAASDDYVAQLATLLHGGLDPDIAVYVEYSNEVWNGLFSQSAWNTARGQDLGLENVEAYAQRTAEIAQIFDGVFGPGALNDRVRVVSSWQVGWSPPDDNYRRQMAHIDANFGPPAELIWGLGVAPYFNAHDAADDATVQQLLDAMRASSDASVEGRSLVLEVAREYQLPGGLLAYEGGPDTGGGSEVNVAHRIEAQRHDEMGELIQHDLVDNWFGIGGGLFMHFTLDGPYSRYGCWGLTDDITDPDRNAKFAAIRAVMEQVE